MKERKISLDFMRIVAIMGTIIIHVSNIYLRSYGVISHGNYLISVIFNSCARICVPLFFMISGALLVNGEYDRTKYLKRIKKYIIILAIWNVIYYFVNVYRGGESNIINAIVYSFFNTDYTSNHLWFMYAIIGLYIALPFVQNMCKNLTHEQENLFMILWLSISGLSILYLPLAKFITGHSIEIEYPVPLINGAYYLGYFVCGHIIYERIKNIKSNRKYNWWCIILYILMVLIIALPTYFLTISGTKIYNGLLWYRGIFIILETIIIFILIIINEDKFKNKNISKIASLTFGVYLIHAIVLFMIKDNIRIVEYSPLIVIPLLSIIIYIVSLGLVYILKKIPFVKEIL